MPIRQIVRSPVVQRALVAIVAAILGLVFPNVLEDALFLLVGITAVVVGAIELVGAWQTRKARDFILATALAFGGIALIIGGETADRYLELLVALVLGIRAVAMIVNAYRDWKSDEGDPFWPLARGILLLLAAAALVVIPHVLLRWVVLLVAVSWIVSGFIVIINTIGEDDDVPVPNDVVSVIQRKSMPASLRQQVTEAIFEGFESKTGGIEFAALMSFATAIATFGVKADSTAVVIGAMLIAPLMGPIMALSAAILMGWPVRAFKALRRVGVGVLIGVGGAFLMSLISPEFVAITSNSEVLSRTSPTILDLLIALAAGGAGGYAMTHPRVGNSLPGVAIAVALAPPLAVVGYSLEELELGFALGAFLLFLTNLVGIIVAAGVTFVVSGYSPWAHIERRGDQTRRSLALVAIALGIIAIPLGIIGEGIVSQTTARTDASAVVTDWLGDEAPYEMVALQVVGNEVTVELEGSGDLPSAEDLATELAVQLSSDIDLVLDVVPRETTLVSSSRSGVVIVDSDDE